MAKFNEDHKKEMNGNFFAEGVHKVKITSATLGKTQEHKEFIEIGIAGEEGQEDNVRVWFTTDKAITYSFNVIRSIVVHNAPEAKKEAARKAVDAIEDTEGLEKACQSLLGKECWFSTYKNLDRPYTKSDGTTAYSYDRNIYGYEPKPKVASASLVTTQVNPADYPEKNEDGGPGDQPFGF